MCSQLHSEVLTCSFSMLGFSDDTNNLIVLFNLSESTSRCSWIRELVSENDLWPSPNATEKWVSRVVKRLVPISLMLETNFAAEVFSSDIKLCPDNPC